MTVFAYPGISNGLAVDANGLAIVGGLAIVDFPASFNTNITVNNPNAIYKNGNNNTFVGHGGYSNTGSNNSFIGAFTGLANTAGDANTFFGASAGRSNTTGARNTFLGFEAGLSNTGGLYCTFVGWGAGKVNTADDNSFFGVQAGLNHVTGFGNVFFGENAGLNDTSGQLNTYIGLNSGRYCTTASGNIIIGQSIDSAHTTGGNNTIIGNGISGYGNPTNTVIISDGVNTKNLTMDAASARFTASVRPPQFTVAALPVASAAGNGAIAFATNGRKGGEAAAAGTGTPVFSNGTIWLCYYNNLQVTA